MAKNLIVEYICTKTASLIINVSPCWRYVMNSSKASHNQAQMLEKLLVHPFSLQGMSTRLFIEVTNKILSGEFGILNYGEDRKKISIDLHHA